MKRITTKISWIIQARMNGGKMYDVIEFKTSEAANRRFGWILQRCFPTWRGLCLSFCVVRRKVTVETEEEQVCFATVPRGKKRILLAEVFVPAWIPKRLQNRYKALPIPGASAKWQPNSKPFPSRGCGQENRPGDVGVCRPSESPGVVPAGKDG